MSDDRVTPPLPASQSSPPQDIRDVLTIKHDGVFLLSDRHGDVEKDSPAALGLYFRDTRFLSRWELRIDGARPLHLHSEADRNYSMLVETTFPCYEHIPGGKQRTENMQISRHRWLESGMRERIHVHNFGLTERRVRLEVAFDADFLDLFQVRGMTGKERGTMRAPDVAISHVTLGYDGRDGVARSTTISFSPAPDGLTETSAFWFVDTKPKEEKTFEISVEPRAGDIEPPALSLKQLGDDYQDWRRACTRFRVSNAQLQAYLDRAVLDLRMMTTDRDGTLGIDAGVPWFSTLFGRDSLITAYQAMIVNPELAKGTLLQLAELQGEKVDPWRDEEPGKIIHEIRVGELAATGEVPHSRYYGSIDSTPLWLVVYGYLWNWTGDLEFIEKLWPNALRALEWIDSYGDSDRDGYVEYERQSDGGLDNQGWKDSFDGILHADGSLPQPPLALAEVQGYVYDARRRLAKVARALGHDDVAGDLEKRAQELRERFNKDFWMNDQGTYAVGLDANKQQIRSVTSNPGHCLWSGIVDRDKAVRLARRLLTPDMLSGYGIRTLSTRNPGFDPIGYHTGSVWPHDNSLIAHGLMLYGMSEQSNRVINELAIAGAFFASYRYPELFCGYARTDVPVPVEYPVACRPQAWATGAPLLMMRSYAGMTADAPTKTLSIVKPSLPGWLERAELSGLRVGDARVDLQFIQQSGVTAVQVLRKDGDLDIVVRY
ncbi:MAG: glycogen debranching N-terminal domain-containing protein [Actinomycetota bacterium]|nr:amylo-alpha-1,6-glucosidase [Actinomycetota bacterium]